MLHVSRLLGLSVAMALLKVSAYPKNISSRGDLMPREESFGIGVMGDSWCSGVTYASDNQYDDNSDGCMRYKYAWSTVIRDSYKDWTPDSNKGSQFGFHACSGTKMGPNEDPTPQRTLAYQMDQMTKIRPKAVFLEAGGNNAIFYPAADACLFHSEIEKIPDFPYRKAKDYGPSYETDDAQNPKGLCRQEINWVRSRVNNNDIKQKTFNTIDHWRGHASVSGNDASLYVIGYPWFFGQGAECNSQTFTLPFASDRVHVTVEMQKDFNDMIDQVNRGIREAVEAYKTDKIQYIDINPAMNSGRFCEPGHEPNDNWNKEGSSLLMWNRIDASPFESKKGDVVIARGDFSTWSANELTAFKNIFKNQRIYGDGDNTIMEWSGNPDDPTWVIKVTYKPDDLEKLNDGSYSRTLHPTQEGHARMGQLVVNRLKEIYGRNGQQKPPPPPAQSPTKALQIIFGNYIDEISNENKWLFFSTPFEKPALCNNQKDAVAQYPAGGNAGTIDKPPFPAGTYKVRVDSMDCEYKNAGTGDAGALWCNGRNGAISCQEDSSRRNGAKKCGLGIEQHSVVVCVW